MPRYELMYILASSVSDDQVPTVSSQIEQFVTDAGGNNTSHEMLGKKKLAYPIKKTRNGHYGVITFSSEGTQVNALDAKLRTQKAMIIRHLIVNLDEHLERLEKDRDAQSKMNRGRSAEALEAERASLEAPMGSAAAPVKAAKPAREVAPVSEADLDKEIEKALTEDVTK